MSSPVSSSTPRVESNIFLPTDGTREVEATHVSPTPLSPSAPELKNNVSDIQKNNFEWNVGRLFHHEEGSSWIVTILSTVLVFPLLLTLIVDIGRRAAFSVGLINGKSWSLVSELSSTAQAVAQKTSAVFKDIIGSRPKTLEDQNRESHEKIRDLAEKLVEGYKGLDGGYFHTNSSFSSPAALEAERQIAKAHSDLQSEITKFISRNTNGTDQFAQVLEQANTMVQIGINDAAGDSFYIENKIERTGPRPLIKNVAFREFLKVQNSSNHSLLSQQFIALARQEPDFASSLAHGLETGVLSTSQAKTAMVREVLKSYDVGLKEGLDSAEDLSENLLLSAIQNKIVTEEEATAISDLIRPEVDVLAVAVAKDVARKETPQTSELEVTQQISKAADKLKEKKRLKDNDESRFLTLAKSQVEKAKEALAAEMLKAQAEAAEIEAQNVAQVRKVADQTSLLNQFLSMIGLIGKKQEELSVEFLNFDQLERKREEVTNQLNSLRETNVTINGQKMTALVAAGEYYKAVGRISGDSNLSSKAKQDRIRDLVNQGFSQQTINKIIELRGLEPQLTEVIDQMAALSTEIDRRHEELGKLVATYKVFRKNNFAGLQAQNRKLVSEPEKKVGEVQKELDSKHKKLTQAGKGLISRLRPEPIKLVNVDPEGNRIEVAELVKNFEESQMPVKEPEPVVVVPAPAPSLARRALDGTMNLGYKFTWPVRYPVGLVASGISSIWNRSKKTGSAAAPLA
jgi:hypothetical protein